MFFIIDNKTKMFTFIVLSFVITQVQKRKTKNMLLQKCYCFLNRCKITHELVNGETASHIFDGKTIEDEGKLTREGEDILDGFVEKNIHHYFLS